MTATATIRRPRQPVVLPGQTMLDLHSWADTVLAVGQPAASRPGGHEVTWADYYCGAGGSSSGIELVLGARVMLAANHWELAVRTHQYNFPDTDHDIADITGVDPRHHPRTDFAWFSPECTTWSVANGQKCDYDGQDSVVIDGYQDSTGDDPEKPLSPEAKVRSRMQMLDVVRFSAYHDYRGVIVENVPDILKWKNLDRWLADMHKLGYKHKILTVNSAFAHGLGAPAPQLRDRVFIVFWKEQYKAPNWDKWLRPQSWCPTCNSVVRGIYTPKPGKRRPMRYGRRAQYTYRCPNKPCGGTAVQPFVMPASSVIDLSKPTQRIRDRKKPLAENTRDRIAAGLARYGRGWVDGQVPMLVPTGGGWNDTTTLGTEPMRTRTTRECEAVVTGPGRPAFLSVLRSGRPRTVEMHDPLATIVANGSNHAVIDTAAMTVSTIGRVGSGRARSLGEPMATQTTRHEAALVQPGALYVPLRANGVAHPAGMVPTKTFAAGGEHHAVVMRNTTPRGGESRCTPLTDPVRTLTASVGQSVLGWGGPGIYSYDTGGLRPLIEPLPTQTTIEGDAVFEPGVEVDDCTLRMLDVDEIQGGMAFDDGFVLLGDAKRDKVRMLGNAVTPCVSRDLAACLMEAVLGVDYELFSFDLALAG